MSIYEVIDKYLDGDNMEVIISKSGQFGGEWKGKGKDIPPKYGNRSDFKFQVISSVDLIEFWF